MLYLQLKERRFTMTSPGLLIKQKRKEKRLTLEEVAQHIGVSKSTVSKYERNMIQNLKRDKLITLCNLLDLSPVELIDNIEIEQEITINGFQTQLNYLLYRTIDLNDSEKNLIKDYVNLICTNKGE